MRQDLPKFEFSGEGGYSGQVKSGKVLMCQDLPEFEFSGEGGYSGQVKSEKS